METPDVDNDILEIVNRSKTYVVSKKLLCASIPYFEKMFSCDFLESKENKVTLDLDESGFNNILSFVYANIFVLKMRNVLQTYDCCDYMMIDDLKKECSDFFYKHFNIGHLPTVLQSIGSFSKLITPQIINCFIQRHFLKISSTETFATFGVDVIEYICKLDLIIDSEYQVYDTIKRWCKFEEGRDGHLIQLMKTIRWCHVDQDTFDKIKRDDLFADRTKLEEILCSPNECKNNCGSNRVIIKTPMIIYEVDKSTIEIVIFADFDGSGLCFPCGHFSLDEKLSSNLITDEHITDIIYDSGRKGIRVDWQVKTFKYLDMAGSADSYDGQIRKYITVSLPTSSEDGEWIEKEVPSELLAFRSVVNRNGQVNRVLVTESKPRNHLRYDKSPAYHTCVIKDTTYKLNRNLEMIIDDSVTKNSKKSSLNKEEITFDDLQLFSYGDELFLCQKSNQSIHKYEQSSEKWSLMCELQTPKTLIAITSTYSSTNRIKMLFDVK